jgi:hypothetical protein
MVAHLSIEHLIYVCVHCDTSILVLRHKVIPVAQRLECVMYKCQYVGLLTGGIALSEHIHCIVINGKRQWTLTECFRKS